MTNLHFPLVHSIIIHTYCIAKDHEYSSLNLLEKFRDIWPPTHFIIKGDIKKTLTRNELNNTKLDSKSRQEVETQCQSAHFTAAEFN